jgi:hypothetical protein
MSRPSGTDRPRLALAWPTYNRPAALADHFDHLLAEAQDLGVPTFVSDDSPDEATAAVVAAAVVRYPGVHYRRNVPPLRHDANLIATLTWPDADYVWLMGDRFRPKPGVLARLLRFLDDQDMVFVNAHSDDHRMVPAATNGDARALLCDVLWHQTLTGATIYHRRMLEGASGARIWPNFPQLSLILDRAARDPLTIGWFGERSLHSVPEATSYWRNKMIEVFAHDWAAVVTAFPQIVPPGERSRVIGTHSRRMNLFSVEALMELKASGEFNWASLRQPWFRQAMHLRHWKLLTLLALPVPVSRRLIMIKAHLLRG